MYTSKKFVVIRKAQNGIETEWNRYKTLQGAKNFIKKVNDGFTYYIVVKEEI